VIEMKPAYELYSWRLEGIPHETAVAITNTVLTRHGAEIDQDCVLILNDHEDQMSSTDFVNDAKTALARLAEWPSLGSIEYHLGDVSVVATFHLRDEGSPERSVGCIQLSVSSDWFDRSRPISEQEFGSIARELHAAARADRTVMTWSGRPSDVSWRDELQRLQGGVREGVYDVDLRLPAMD
jgi:hypothetical protein